MEEMRLGMLSVEALSKALDKSKFADKAIKVIKEDSQIFSILQVIIKELNPEQVKPCPHYNSVFIWHRKETKFCYLSKRPYWKTLLTGILLSDSQMTQMVKA